MSRPSTTVSPKVSSRAEGAAAVWLAGGVAYVGIALWTLVSLRDQDVVMALVPVGSVIATDIGAYFAGRTIGGAKIAPAISPSKTWAGLGGGMVASGFIMVYTLF